MTDKNGNWLFYKWWYLVAAAVSAALFIAGLFARAPLILIGGLGLVTCFFAYHRLDPNEKYYGITLNQRRFHQWWWWFFAVMSLASLSADTDTFLFGMFFMLLAAVALFMPSGRKG